MNHSEQSWPGYGTTQAETPQTARTIAASSEIEKDQKNVWNKIPDVIATFLLNFLRRLADRKEK